MVLFPKYVFSTLIVRFFAKNQKVFEVGKLRKYDGESECFKKTLSSFNFKKATLRKLEGRKYPDGSQPSCYFYIKLSTAFV